MLTLMQRMGMGIDAFAGARHNMNECLV